MPDVTEAKRAAWDEAVLRLNLIAILSAKELKFAKVIHSLGFDAGRAAQCERIEAMLPELDAKGAADLAARMLEPLLEAVEGAMGK